MAFTVMALKKWIGGLVALFILAGLSAAAVYWTMRCSKNALLSHKADVLSDVYSDPALSLSKEQKQQIRQLEAAYFSKVCDSCTRHCTARAKIGELLQTGNTMEEELQKLAQEVGSAYSDSEQATIHHVVQVCQVLTPEQKKVFLSKVAAQISAVCPQMEMPSGFNIPKK